MVLTSMQVSLLVAIRHKKCVLTLSTHDLLLYVVGHVKRHTTTNSKQHTRTMSDDIQEQMSNDIHEHNLCPQLVVVCRLTLFLYVLRPVVSDDGSYREHVVEENIL